MKTPRAPGVATLALRLKFRQLVLLDALGDTMSLRKAAAATHTTQPAATRSLSEIETAFGVRLFERSPRGIVPTVFGQALIRHARQLLFDVERAREEIQALQSGSHGFVRIGTLVSSAMRLLPMAIADVKRQFPRMRISVEQHPQPPLIAKLREGSLDVVLARLIPPSPDVDDIEQTVLFDDDFTLVAARQHRLGRQRAALSLAELVAEPWILPHAGGALYDHVRAQFLTATGRLPSNIVESTTAMGTNLMLIEHHGYLHFMQRTVAQVYEQRGVLRILPLSLGSPMGPHVMAVRRSTSHPPAVDAVRAALQGVVARGDHVQGEPVSASPRRKKRLP